MYYYVQKRKSFFVETRWDLKKSLEKVQRPSRDLKPSFFLATKVQQQSALVSWPCSLLLRLKQLHLNVAIDAGLVVTVLSIAQPSNIPFGNDCKKN